MYAVIETGGKQYRCQPGDILQIEKLEGDVGSSLSFDQVLYLSKKNQDGAITLGKPLISGAKVVGEIVGQGRGEKCMIVKMKKRKQYRRTQGHRQFQTQVLVTGIDSGSGDKALLSAEAKTAELTKFQSHLKPRGPASVNPHIVRREKALLKREAQSTAPKSASAKTAEAPIKTAAKKATPAPKAAEKKSAPAKKTTPKK